MHCGREVFSYAVFAFCTFWAIPVCYCVCIFTAFGFCEFGNPDAALRAIRLLHDYEIAEKKLVVKADAKTKEVLDDYKGERFCFTSTRAIDTVLCKFLMSELCELIRWIWIMSEVFQYN